MASGEGGASALAAPAPAPAAVPAPARARPTICAKCRSLPCTCQLADGAKAGPSAAAADRDGADESDDEVGVLVPAAVGGESAAAAGAANQPQRLTGTLGKKRKVIIVLAYIGSGYQGMQRNPGVKSIEDEVAGALVRAGCILPEDHADFSRLGWTRAARTDKGVSAVGNVVSLQCATDLRGGAGNIPLMLSRLNDALPPAIRAVAMQRVVPAFNAKNDCDRRRYDYLLPVSGLHDAAVARDVASEDVKQERDLLADGPLPAATPAAVAPWVFDDDARARLNGILETYVGTHNFHNFTQRMSASDATASRYVLSFQAAGPITVGGVPYVKLTVVGQSFILHQIRKMVGMAVAIFRGRTTMDVLAMALSREWDVATPMAPATGLYLAECIFDSYNRRFGDLHGKVDLGVGDVAAAMDAFKVEHVYPHIAREEAIDGSFALWVRSINERAFRFECVPAVLTKGRGSTKRKKMEDGD